MRINVRKWPFQMNCAFFWETILKNHFDGLQSYYLFPFPVKVSIANIPDNARLYIILLFYNSDVIKSFLSSESC